MRALLAALALCATLRAQPPEFVTIPPGEFQMGCGQQDTDCPADAKPAHRVRITRPFELARQTHPVGTKAPNPWGLYDRFGNVEEWVQDWYSTEYYKSSPIGDSTGPAEGRYHIARGGSWFSISSYLRVWERYETVQVPKRRDTCFRYVRERVR